jgi:hypothetical protein
MRATAVARLIACSSVLLLAGSAAAQFDPQHDHLTCYRIKGQRITTTAVIDNQFGHEDLVQLTPALLCLPTHKTVAPPGVDPLPPAAVRHFKCYKVRRVKGAAPPTVRLTDQFGTEVVRVRERQLFCTPVLKEVMGPTTTTVTTTTVTTTSVTIPLVLCDGGDSAPTCGGTCPPGDTCVATQLGGLIPTCGCFPTGVTPCGGSAFPQCGGACLGDNVCNPHLVTGPGGPIFQGCLCDSPGPCSPTGPPSCGAGGDCPGSQICTTFVAGGAECGCAP